MTASAISTPAPPSGCSYNAKLRKYVLDSHYMDTLEFHTIPGSMIIDRFGYRECPRQ